jgi:hypothetical protein
VSVETAPPFKHQAASLVAYAMATFPFDVTAAANDAWNKPL